MADYQIQEERQRLRSGYFGRDVFRKKSRLLLVLKTGIAGLAFQVDDNTEEGRKLLEALTPGTELQLFREADNEYDPWAIAVYTSDNQKLGYVTRYKNETVARLMDCGKVFRAYVDEPPKSPEDQTQVRNARAATENYQLPFSIYMEE